MVPDMPFELYMKVSELGKNKLNKFVVQFILSSTINDESNNKVFVLLLLYRTQV